ncbi:exosortase/archaeosortase family protein [uncultured Thiodictyon sp.]|uniref:exosortase/archaeosortase family protein n=1 Tax=uncultured Thiodictyon sp. TaxID=1846217 RepID=UPI0025F4680C|nr:exosortase/archaeosortase family protein [uncultured Thiodictyon sp.]
MRPAAPAARLAHLLPRAAWLPWLAFAAVLIMTGVRTAADPLRPSYDDDLMLLATLGMVLWIERAALAASLRSSGDGRPWVGTLLFAAGCLASPAGRFSGSFAIEAWALFLLPAGLVAAFAPREQMRAAWFLAGAGTVVVAIGRIAPAALSSDLAVWLAAASAGLISAVAFPVVAVGVRQYFGPYSTEVTQACAGMNSLFALTALAVLYLREGRRRPFWHILLLVACVIPVAVLSNFLRIVLLVLSTQLIGVRFAQGLFHDTAGFFVFALALALLAGIDSLARRMGAGDAGD